MIRRPRKKFGGALGEAFEEIWQAIEAGQVIESDEVTVDRTTRGTIVRARGGDEFPDNEIVTDCPQNVIQIHGNPWGTCQSHIPFSIFHQRSDLPVSGSVSFVSKKVAGAVVGDAYFMVFYVGIPTSSGIEFPPDIDLAYGGHFAGIFYGDIASTAAVNDVLLIESLIPTYILILSADVPVLSGMTSENVESEGSWIVPTYTARLI